MPASEIIISILSQKGQNSNGNQRLFLRKLNTGIFESA